MTRSILFTLCATIAFSPALFSSTASAEHINPGTGFPSGGPHVSAPTGLNIGDQYRLAFVSEAPATTAQSALASDYNAVVQGLADAVPSLQALGLTWNAVVSTATVDARDNTDTCPTCTDVPIFLLDTTQLATNNADLWDGSLSPTFNVHQLGVRRTNGFRVWTGTDPTGVATANPLGSGQSQNTIGVSSRENSSSWVENGLRNVINPNSGNPETNRIYAISGVLTVVPEPSSMMLILFGACGMLAKRRRGK